MKNYRIHYLKAEVKDSGKINVVDGGAWDGNEHTTVHAVHEPTGDLLRVFVKNIDCSNHGAFKLKGYTDVKTGKNFVYFITSVRELKTVA